ncbi:MAG: orotate phosphoribosyltransferase [Rhodospirillaceae bacterium]|jgi:orotate phosphoribosyltransferase|nr:orotate phosphoribosyltransferase [Rhodospirillaceae bacterium]MBT6119257.1 orotate phosphoribosyltransferase [Rhodospirillaceae bacterium]
MADTKQAGRITARVLLDIKAVNFRPDEPYVFTSGRVSPVYIDCRKIISFPAERTTVLDLAAAMTREFMGAEGLDAVAGGETAGIPYAAWLAERLDLPMLYVRKQPKGFGRMAQIEGDMPEGWRVLLVEDLATDGGSKINFIQALKEAGAKVTDTLVVFHYGIFPQSTETLAAEGVRLHGLATWRDVLDEARRGGDFPVDVLDKIEDFLADPDGWAAANAHKAG